ncbi:phosphoglycerate mutase [Roseibium aquae]|uniref:Phosphoglycerate mutase n=1 Tax=Roseibium aquae TaxID=1323746 RepID=A0A916TBQ1_9HYPH|nr:histidine phosphatase family protein [Roseibium aquae]GGB37244.1 phosphoglycerate mutase [Roseibium aquae]
MKRLILYRHAKSDWGDPALADKDRPLNERGRQAAPVMAAYLREQNLNPDRILCSTSLRTRETLAPLLLHLTREVEIHLLDALYDDHGLDYLPILRRHAAPADVVMIIGHNPAMDATAYSLVQTREGPVWQDMSAKFPTGAIAVLDFAIADWRDLTVESGQLVSFAKPRDLMP